MFPSGLIVKGDHLADARALGIIRSSQGNLFYLFSYSARKLSVCIRQILKSAFAKIPAPSFRSQRSMGAAAGFPEGRTSKPYSRSENAVIRVYEAGNALSFHVRARFCAAITKSTYRKRMNRPLQFHKRHQFFFDTHDETLSVAMRVNHPNYAPIIVER